MALLPCIALGQFDRPLQYRVSTYKIQLGSTTEVASAWLNSNDIARLSVVTGLIALAGSSFDTNTLGQGAWIGRHDTNGYLTAETDPNWAAVSNTITTQAEQGAEAYGWGDHDTNGYLTGYTETDPVWASWRTNAAAGTTNAILPDGTLVDLTGLLGGGDGGVMETQLISVVESATNGVMAWAGVTFQPTNAATGGGMTRVQRVEVGESVASFRMWGWSADATLVHLIGEMRSDRAAISDSVRLRFNDDAGTRYWWQRDSGSGSSASAAASGATTSLLLSPCSAARSPPQAFTFVRGMFPVQRYASHWATLASHQFALNTNTSIEVGTVYGMWQSTAAPTSIVVLPNLGANIVTGSWLEVWEIVQ